jgi:hypothetical protein
MIETENYVQIGADTQLSYEVSPLDQQAQITIGPVTGRGAAIHLLFSDAAMLRSVAETMMQARDDFVREIIEHGVAASPTT